MSNVTPLASVVITSRNRKDDLLNAIDSCLNQSVPVEVLIYDDASTDGSAVAILEKYPPARFPQVRVFPQQSPVGYIVLRNRGARDARTNIIVSIDDDAIFTTASVVEDTLRAFDHPRIGAVAIPFQNIRISEEMFQRAPDTSRVYVTSDYIGTAHAVRRDLFLSLGGYRETFVHQGEESDYCIRLLNSGYVVRLGSSDAIHHFVSPKRDMARLHYYGARNNILFVWYNVPVWRRPWDLARSTLGTLAHGIRVKAFWTKLEAVKDGYFDGMKHRTERRPVSTAVLQLFRELRRSAKPLTAIEGRLPSISMNGGEPERGLSNEPL